MNRPKDTEEMIKRLAKDMSGGKLSAEEIEKKIREAFKKWNDGGQEDKWNQLGRVKNYRYEYTLALNCA